MAIEDGLIYQIPQNIIDKAGLLITILQALGIFIILYLIFMVVNTIINRKRKNELMEMNEHLKEIKEILRRQKR